MNNIIIVVFVSVMMSSCSIRKISYVKTSIDDNDPVEVHFVDNPKVLRAKKEYEVRIFEKENPNSILRCTTNNGKFTKYSNTEHDIFSIKPARPGEMVIEIFKEEKNAEDQIIMRYISKRIYIIK